MVVAVVHRLPLAVLVVLALLSKAPPGVDGQTAPGAYGQAAPGVYGQAAPGAYGQAAPGAYGQAAPGVYGQAAPGVYGQAAPGAYGQAAPGVYGQAASPAGSFDGFAHSATVTEDLFLSALVNGSVRPDAQAAAFWLTANKPACFVATLDGPAGASHAFNLYAKPYRDVDVGLRACLSNAIRWAAVVSEYDQYSAALKGAVGYIGTLESQWASRGFSSRQLLPDETDPASAPGATDQQIFNCFNVAAGRAANDSAVEQCVATQLNQAAGQATETVAEQVLSTCFVNNPLQINLTDITRCINALPRPKSTVFNTQVVTGKVQKGLAGLRTKLALQPLLREPLYPGRDVTEKVSPTPDMAGDVIFTRDYTNVYRVEQKRCSDAFSSPSMPNYAPDAVPATNAANPQGREYPGVLSWTGDPKSSVSYDSCYITQTLVYIYYDGSCASQVPPPPPEAATDPNVAQEYAYDMQITTTARYSAYTMCFKQWRLDLTEWLILLLLIFGAPCALCIIILACPTLVRIAYRPFQYLSIKLLSREKQYHKIVQRTVQLETDAPIRWGWWARLMNTAPVKWFRQLRKQLVYACVTVTSVSGHNRMLQVMIMSMCTVAVTALVWHPDLYIELDKAPQGIILQFTDDPGPTSQLIKYLRIVLISLFLGVLGYLASIANLNDPGSAYWTTQSIISVISMTFLSGILAVHTINVGAFLPLMRQKAAYGWLVGVQCFNILMAVILEVMVVTSLRRHRKQKESKVSPAANQRPLKLGSEVQDVEAPKAGDELDGAVVPKPKKSRALKPFRKLWKKIKKWYMDTVGEEVTRIQTGDGSRVIEVHTFKYPAWFLASVLVALYMLVFHFAKSLAWGEAMGECVIQPDDCPNDRIRKWASTVSPGQLELGRAAFKSVSEMLNSTGEVKALLNAVLAVKTGAATYEIDAKFNSAVESISPEDSQLVKWKDQFGRRIKVFSGLGFTLGLLVGFTTLFGAMRSFKTIIKHNRALKLLRRLEVSGPGGGASPGSLQRQHQLLRDMAVVDHDMSAAGPSAAPGRRLSSMEVGSPGSSADAAAGISIQESSKLHSAAISQSIRQSEYNKSAMIGMDMRILSDESSSSSSSSSGADSEAEDGTVPAGGDNTRKIVKKKSSKGMSFIKSFTRSKARSKSGSRRHGDEQGSGDEQEAGKARQRHDVTSEVFTVTNVAAVRALQSPIGSVVFFIGVLLSSTVVQLYAVGTVFSVALAIIFHPLFWSKLVPDYWPYVAVFVAVFVLNKQILTNYVGNTYVSDGDRILRPAGWFAFVIIGSITNLVLGLLLAIARLAILLLQTIFTIGMLDRSIFIVLTHLDLPYQSFLAGIHLQNALQDLHDPALRPGSKGKAVKRWRAAAKAVIDLGPDEYEKVAARNNPQGNAFPSPEPGAASTTKGDPPPAV